MAKDVRIIPANGEINFNETGVEKVSIYQSGNDIHIAPVGAIYLGDGTAANLQLGDVATSVDIQFLGGGTITSNGGTLSIGSTGDVVNLNVTGVTYNLPQINAQSLQGYVPSSFALASHTHTISNVTGLQTALDGKQPVGSYLTGIAANSIGAAELNVTGNGTTAQYLRSDADGSFTWATPPDTNTTYSQATTSTLGLIKLGDATAQTVAANTVTATASRTYALQVNASGQGVVNVPWTDTNTTYSQATDAALGLIKLGSATAQTVAANTVTATASRTYALQVNASGQGVVNVPWVDTNTTYSQATTTALGLIKLGDATAQTVAANAVTATASRTYAVQVNASGQAVVNVPWTDANTTYTAGTGLTLSSTTFSVTANGIGAAQLNVTGNGTTAQYLRSDGDGSFTWATPPDTNTTYSAGNGLLLTGTTFSTNSTFTQDIDMPGIGLLKVLNGLIVDFTPA